MKDDLNGLDKAVSAVLGERTIERNQLLIRIAKSKLTKQEKNEKATKPEELVRLYDLLLQVKNHFIVFCFLHAFHVSLDGKVLANTLLTIGRMLLISLI